MELIKSLIDEKKLNFIDLQTMILKDIEMSGMDTDYFVYTESSVEFGQQLVSFISELLERHPEHFQRLMYRIDIPEQKLQEILHTDFSQLSIFIAELIVKREIQKLIFRKQFG